METNPFYMLYLGMNAVAFATTIVMCFHVGNLVTKKFFDQRMFLYMLFSTMAFIVFDSGSLLIEMSGRADARWVLSLDSMLLFVVSPLPSFFWLRYCDYKLNNDRRSLLQRVSLVGIPVGINTVLSVASLATHWFFWVDEQCVFQRGPLGWVTWLVALGYFPMSYLVLARRKHSAHAISRKERSIFFLLFPLPPVIGALLQYYFAISLIGVGLLFSSLFIFINIQNRKLYTDELTSAFNRRYLEIHMEHALRVVPAGMVAYVLMTDIDDFKAINDAHGSVAGDAMLVEMYALLKREAPADALISRFGGDEFVIFGQTSDVGRVETLRHRIEERLTSPNAQNDASVELHLTIGIALYRPEGLDSSDDLIRRASDQLHDIKHRKAREQAENLSRVQEYERLLIEATKGLYENIYEVDITHNCACSKATREYFESLGLSGSIPLNQAVRHIATRQIQKDFRKGYLDKFAPANALRAYKNGIDSFSYDFLFSSNGEDYHWMRITARIFCWSYDHSVRMITFRQNIDEEKKRELEPLRKAQELENELAQSRISIMLSQIQPHFLYNTLIVIKQLCDQDPQLAKDAIVEFSNYLRGNLDALTRKLPIPFEKELEHVENYLALEKKRFGSRIHVVYTLETKDFLLPPLTVQPIVENAVRYGLTKQASGGTLTIATAERAHAYVITISDDGVGFDATAAKQDGRSHTGIENVRNRLFAMCKGSMTVQSVIGSGTKVTIEIPKGTSREQHAYEK